jgi:hypothetical protein
MKALLLLTSMFIARLQAQVIFKQYFPAKANTVQQYNVTLNYAYDTPLESIEKKICRAINIKGKTVYYFTTPDNEKDSGYAVIGSGLFANGVFYFDNGRFMHAPVFWKNDLVKAVFIELFPENIFLEKAYIFKDGEETREYIFKGFESIEIKNRKLDSCLKLVVEQHWPANKYTDTVWFRKNVGVVKWMRSTGRVEELISK